MAPSKSSKESTTIPTSPIFQHQSTLLARLSMSRTFHPSMEKMKLRRLKSRGRLFPKGGANAARPTDVSTSPPTCPPSGPMTHARAKLLQAKVNSLLSSCDFDTPLDGLLLHSQTLCILSYEPKEASSREGPKTAEEILQSKPAPGPTDRSPRRQFRR